MMQRVMPGAGGRVARAVAGAAIALLGLALLRVWAPAAVIVTFIGLMVATVSTMLFPHALTKLASWAALGLHAAAVALVSGAPLLGAVAFLAFAGAIQSATLVRRLGYHSPWIAFGLFFVALATLFLAKVGWPAMWPALPTLVAGLLGSANTIRGARELRALGSSAWRIGVGDEVPDFELPDRLGRGSFRLSEERGNYVLLCFLRGDWCPVCRVKMKIYQHDAPELKQQGVRLVAVSPSEGPEAEGLARALGIDYTLLVDPRNEVAARFGAVQQAALGGKGAPLPVSFLIDPDGKLQHGSRPDDIATFLDPLSLAPILQSRGENARQG